MKTVQILSLLEDITNGVSEDEVLDDLLFEKATNAAYAWASKMGVPSREAERRWKEAEKASKKQGMHPDKDGSRYYGYTMGIFKKMMYQNKGQNAGGRGTKALKASAKEEKPMPRVPA